MTAKATLRPPTKREITRWFDLFEARGIPVFGVDILPGGKVHFDLTGGPGRDNKGANPWDAALGG